MSWIGVLVLFLINEKIGDLKPAQDQNDGIENKNTVDVRLIFPSRSCFFSDCIMYIGPISGFRCSIWSVFWILIMGNPNLLISGFSSPHFLDSVFQFCFPQLQVYSWLFTWVVVCQTKNLNYQCLLHSLLKLYPRHLRTITFPPIFRSISSSCRYLPFGLVFRAMFLQH